MTVHSYLVRKKFTLQLAVPCCCESGADCTENVHIFIYSVQLSNEAGTEIVPTLRRRELSLHSVQSLAPGYLSSAASAGTGSQACFSPESTPWATLLY